MARKLLSLVVALAVVLSSMSFAFAATDAKTIVTGVTDETTQNAISKLFALGMTDGMDDGQFHPEKNLTRAEATTFIVRALGLESAAAAAKGATAFTDVTGDHWASGYINVAAGQGLVQGMGDGTFAPESQVTYAQAVTMLVRALGYQDSFLKGTWPGNYLAKAADAKITKSVTFSPDGVANRGSIAIMLGNTLDARVVKITEYAADGIKYGEIKTGSDDHYVTLVEDKMEIVKDEDYRIVSDYRLGGTAVDTLGVVDADGNSDSIKKADGLNYQNLMGAKVNLYVDTSGATNKILFVEKSGSSEVIYDTIDSAAIDTDNDTATVEFKTRFGKKTYMFDNTNKVLYFNNTGDSNLGTAGGSTPVISDILGGAYGRLVIEGNKVVFAELYGGGTSSSNGTWNYEALLVDSVSGTSIKYWDENGSNSTLDIAANYPGGAIVRVNGDIATLADLKPFDVIYVSESTPDSKLTANLFAIRNSVTGEVKGSKNGGGSIDIGGTVIDVGALASSSTNSNEDIDSMVASTSDVEDVADDMYGASAVAYKDVYNKIRHIASDVTTSSGEKYGIIKKVNLEAETVKVFTQDGSDVTYSFDDTDKIGYQDTSAGTHLTSIAALKAIFDVDTDGNYDAGDYIFASYKLTKDGKIAEDSLLVKNSAVAGKTINGDFGTDTLYAGGTMYVNTENVAVFDTASYIANQANDLEIASWDSLADKDQPTGLNTMTVIPFTKGEVKGDSDGDVLGLFVIQGNASSDAEAAYVISYFKRDGDDYARLHKFGKDQPEEIKVSSSGLKESAQVIKNLSGDKVSIDVADSDFTTVGGKVYKIDGNKYYINGLAESNAYKAESGTIVYSGDAMKALSSIQENDMIVAVVKQGKIQAIEWNQTDITSTRAVAATTDAAGALVGVPAAWNSADVNMIFSLTGNDYSTIPANKHVLVWKKYGENKVRSVLVLD